MRSNWSTTTMPDSTGPAPSSSTPRNRTRESSSSRSRRTSIVGFRWRNTSLCRRTDARRASDIAGYGSTICPLDQLQNRCELELVVHLFDQTQLQEMPELPWHLGGELVELVGVALQRVQQESLFGVVAADVVDHLGDVAGDVSLPALETSQYVAAGHDALHHVDGERCHDG